MFLVIIIIWPLWALMNSAVSAPTLGAIFLFKGIFVQCLQYMPGKILPFLTLAN